MNTPDHKPAYDNFIQKLTEIVRQNLDNPLFGVTELSQEAGISRSQLHRKLKLIKNKSVSQFIRDIRLDEALKLLQYEDLTVSEVAYRVGFNSPTYFHKCFHLQYGCVPGDIKKGNNVIKNYNGRDLSKDNTYPASKKTQVPWLHIFNKQVALGTTILLAFVILAVLYNYNRSSPSYKALAVLPLHNYTGQPEQDYFVRGFHDALIGTIGQLSGIRVISRTSTLRYEKPNLPLNQIAKDLGVDVIVEGSISGSGQKTFIQLQLIDVFPEERHLWSKKYNQDLSNVLVIEKDVVQNIVQQLNISLTPLEENLLHVTYPVNPEAYKAYLKGMFHWNKLNQTDLDLANEYFTLSLQHDPDYALAYAGISLVWVGRLQQGLISYKDGISNLKAAAEKALSLDSTLAEVHYSLGCASCWVEWNFKKAEQELRMAIAYNPNFSHARAYLSHVLMILHQPEEALQQIEMAIKLDPYNDLFNALYGMVLNFSGQYDKAEKVMNKILKTEPDDLIALSTLRTTYHMKGMYPEALEIWKSSYKNDEEALAALQQGQKAGGYSGALTNLAQLLISRSETSYVTPWKIATLYVRAGKTDEAIHWLENAFHANDSNMPYIGIDPIFDILRNDPRFQQLLKRMNFKYLSI